jgi:hypothetical protein
MSLRSPRGRVRLLPLLAVAVALVLVAAGCGRSSSGGGSGSGAPTASVNPNAAEKSPAGDIPDDQAYVAYTPPGGGFSVKVPEGWGRQASGGTVTFTDKLNSIRMETTPAAGPLTVAQARSREVPKLARTEKGFSGAKVSSVSRSAGPATRITYVADSAADPVTGKVRRNAVERYVFFHAGRDVVLTLSGPKGADNVDPWKFVTDSLRWQR